LLKTLEEIIDEKTTATIAITANVAMSFCFI
jgi:hypothetical protein